MNLYTFKGAPNARRVTMFVAEKGIDLAMDEVDLANRAQLSDEYAQVNPYLQVPALELDDGSVLTESIAICRYFEELHPAPALFGADTLARAQVEMWNRRAELGLLSPVSQAFRHGHPFWKGRHEQIEAIASSSREAALKTMRWLDAELAGRAYLAGGDYTVADITAQCAVLLGKNTGTPVPDDCENLLRWWKQVTARPTARA